jgi:DNA polymerase delta subunit 1
MLYSHLTQRSVSGGHTRAISIATPTIGGLMKFAVKTVTCLGCKTALKLNNSVTGTLASQFHILSFTLTLPIGGAVCNNCRPRLGELYQKQVTTTSEVQVRFARLWTQCQRCQGSLHQVRSLVGVKIDCRLTLPKDVLCTSKDCPIFYMRKKAQKDVEDQESVLDRFSDEMW